MAETETEIQATATPVPKLDELALRKPGFTEGVWITLLDGQEWCFPCPYRIYTLADMNGDGSKLARKIMLPGGGDYPDLHAKLFECKSDDEIMKMQLDAVKLLMDINYSLPPGAFLNLVQMVLDSDNGPPEIAALTLELRDVIYGRATPKSREQSG
jgi:hypothetical protein